MQLKEFLLKNYVMLFELIGLLIVLRISVHISLFAGEREIIDAIAELRRKLKETPYTCAFGYAMKDADKAATKQRTLEQGGMLHGRAQ